MNFKDLIAPLSVDTFFERYWERDFCKMLRQQESYYADIFNGRDLDQFLSSQQLDARFVKTIKAGELEGIENWSSVRNVSAAGDSARFVDGVKLLNRFNDGYTIVLYGVHRAIPSLTQFCLELEQALSFPLQINCYITPPGSRGLSPHYDNHDVFVLQIEGRKRWRVFSASDEKFPLQQTADSLRAVNAEHPIDEFELNSGDCLYLPRGQVHCADTEQSASVHLTLGLRPTYRYQLLEQLVAKAKEQEFFRRALPHGYAKEEDWVTFRDQFQTAMSKLLGAISTDELLAEHERQLDNIRLHSIKGLFSDRLKVEDIRLNSVLIRRESLKVVSENKSDGALLRSRMGELVLPRFLATAADYIATNKTLCVSDIPGLMNDQGRLELAKMLVKQGIYRFHSE